MLRFFPAVGLCALCVAAQLNAASAKSEIKVLHTFKGSDGMNSHANLIMDGEGNLYGTALGGSIGGGTAFKIAPNGDFTTLYSFTGGADGAEPQSGLTLGGGGVLYGTTPLGGANDEGTVFSIAPDGTETVLHSFAGDPDGADPYAGLIADGAGNLYGTAVGGGKYNNGTVFRLAPDGTFTMLYAFKGGRDGARPYASLIADGAGNLYGTTRYGGKGNCSDSSGDGCGTVFKLAPDGKETVLCSFKGGKDGALPYAGLIADGAGNLYGTTPRGGKNDSGTVFKLAPDGKETVLYRFKGKKDGLHPVAGVIADAAGNLYGTTYQGGKNNSGVVFRLAPNGKESVLYSFTGRADGGYPYAGLTPDGAGNLYSTTYQGGNLYGVVFEILAKGK